MSDNHDLLERDIQILEAMVADLPDYLMSEATRWTMRQPELPPLTIGGCLMRLHRLGVLKNKLSPEQQSRLQTAVDQYDQSLIEKVVRFETRAHQELHARLGEWSQCLRTLQCTSEQYANKVDTRVVIEALIDALKERPYELEAQVLTETRSLDYNLRSRWHSGSFVWDDVWQPAYPQAHYWWLYGHPVQKLEHAR